MLLHTVFFWLRDDLDESAKKAFENALAGLLKIKGIKFKYIGKPAATRRAVIDRTYSYKFVIGFDDIKGHDYYQDCETHKEFVDAFKNYWVKVQVYDGEEYKIGG